MKKAIRITAWILGLLFLLQIGAVVVLQSSAVQTWLGRKVIGTLQEKMDADITFGSASIRPFDALILEDVLVMDRATPLPDMDTLLHVKHLSARFSVMGLLSGGNIRIKRANLDGGCFHLIIEDGPYGETTNLERIFRMPPPEGDPEYRWGDILDARNLEIKNMHFRMENIPGARDLGDEALLYGEEAIDWNHLNLILEHLKVNHLAVADDLITADARELQVHELVTGLRLEGLSARKVQVGKANVLIEELRGRLSPGNTVLNLPTFQMAGPMDDYGDFVDAIRLSAEIAEGTQVDMRTISHFAPGLEQMGFRGSIRGRMDGTVSDFRLLDMAVDGLDEKVKLRATGRMTGLPDAQNTRLDVQIRELSFTTASLAGFIRDWAPDVELDAVEEMAPGETFSLNGNVGGTLDAMTVDADIDSRLGSIEARLRLDHAIDQHEAIAIGGNLNTDRLNLGGILGRSDLGLLSMRSRLETAFPQSGPQVQLDSLRISQLGALGYTYSGIGASGSYRPGDFNLSLKADDPALKLDAHGVYHEDPDKDGFLDMDLNLKHANLQAMQLDGRGKSLVTAKANARLLRENAHTTGELRLADILLQNDGGPHPVEDISLQVDAVDSLHNLQLKSALMDASYSGGKDVLAFVPDLVSLLLEQELPALSPERASFSGTPYKLDFQVHKMQDLLDFVLPGMYLENGTNGSIGITRGGHLKASLESGRIALRDKYVKDLRLQLDNGSDALSGELSGSALSLGGARTNNNRISLRARDNQLGLRYTFNNDDSEADTRADFHLSGMLERDGKGILGISGRAQPSSLCYRGETWDFSSGEISYKGGRVLVDHFLASHKDQQLLVNGGYSPGQADTLSLTMDQFNLSLVNTIAGDEIPPLEGQITGRARVLSSASASTGILASVVCDSTSIAGKRLGQVRASSIWDEAESRFKVHLRNKIDGRNAILAHASVTPSSQQVQADVQLDRFPLGVAEPFLNTVFSQFGGALSGQVNLDGKWNELHVSSHNLRLDDGILCPDFTRVPYQASGTLGLDDKGLHFQDVALTDGDMGTGRVEGSILMNLNRLQDIRLDTHVRMRDMQALALPRGANPTLYGNLAASGHVDITGALDRITLAVDAAVSRSGEFHLPIGSSLKGSSTEILRFTEPEPLVPEDPYEQMMAVEKETHVRSSDLHFAGRFRATPELQVNLDLDEDNSITAFGNGTIEVDYRTLQDSFTLGGDYAISNGSFHFSAMNLVSRNFTIQEGSTVRFNGDVMDTSLDVKGRYTTKASISNLIPSYDEGNAASTRRTVYCGVNISGKISNPVVDFDIDIPDLNPIIQSQVESALNSEDKVQKQFVYLLIAGNFLPTEESGVTTNGSDVLYSNVSSIMSGQLNNIFQKLDIPLDLGLSYQTTQAGSDLFDVAVSTQLFRGRVLVNGTVGNRQMMGGVTTNEVAGDVDVEIKLNRSGSLRMSLFSHSADQYTYYLDNSQRNGGGITYQREFNSIVQFFRELFASRRKREAMALEAATRPSDNVVLQIDSTGRSTRIYEPRQ